MSNKKSNAAPNENAAPHPEALDPLTGTEHRDFSVFTVAEKRAIVSVGSMAAFFSPLSSTIYFPALDTVAKALGVSTTKVNLTVTTYLILQGIAPMLIAGFSDTAGRRPAYIICFTIYLAANLGLGLQNSYAALLVLRCLQSAGSSGTVALANGLVGDMITSAERGSYIAFASLGSMLGPSVSPIIGGLISQYLDWHWLFWFLLILSGIFFVLLLLFLPETCRQVVGDGSIPPPPLNASVNLETGAILLVTGLMYAGFYAIMTGATASFHNVYGLNNIETALMYLPLGIGGIVSAFTTGRLVDFNYRRHAKRAGMPVVRSKAQDLSNFNIEKARLEIALPAYYLSAVCMIVYGWLMGRRVHLAAPAVLLFFSGWSLNATSQVLNALLVDVWPGQAAAATAANNLMRCELGAAASAAISPMQRAMGWGWAYTTLALISIAASPVLWLITLRGIKWRQRRARRESGRVDK